MTSSLAVEPSDFRRTLGHFCTGIVVVTGRDAGELVGFTAQSLVSLSLAPPLVGLSPSKESETWPRLRNAKEFCVSILCNDQRDVCNAFSRRAVDRFANVCLRASKSDLPVIEGSLAYVCCSLDAEYETGDHYFVVGRVHELEVLRPERKPLLFYKGAIHSE